MKKLIFFFLITVPAFLSAQKISSRILDQQWDAYWIAVPGESPNGYGIYNFRKVITINDNSTSFVIHVSADNRYKLFVNNQLVSVGPARGDLFYWNYETVDLSPFLHTGENVLSAVVWNFGSHSPEAQISLRTGFIMQGNSEKEAVVNTNHSWKCIRDSAYSPLEPELIYTYYVAGPGEEIDYNIHDDRWKDQSYNDGDWNNAEELSKGLPKGVFFWSTDWMLVPRSIPPMELAVQRLNRVRDEKDIVLPKEFPSKQKQVVIPPHKKISFLLDQGFLTDAYPVLKFSRGKDALISLSYAEALYVKEASSDWRSQHKKGNRDVIEGKRFVGVKDRLKSSGREDQAFMSLWWRTYRYLLVEIETKDESLSLDDLYGLYTGYPFKLKAVFDADRPELSSMLDVGWRTARLCAMETYMDCPYYEQLQYIGDTRIQALVSLYNSGDDRLMRNAITLLDQSRLAEGITMSRYPTAHAQIIPPFSLWWIGMLHDYWTYRPDTSFVKEYLPGMRLVLNWYNGFQGSDGSLVQPSYWNFTDWVNSEGWDRGVPPLGSGGESAILDLQLLWAYELASELENDLGMKSFSELYQQKAEQLKNAIRGKYWDASHHLFADTGDKKYFSQHANALAILTGTVAGGEAHDLMERVLNNKSLAQASIYFKYYVHLAAEQAGMGDKYIDLLGDWRDQLANGLTTWAEISDHNQSRSDCHAWGASPNIEFFRILLGIDSNAPGFKSIRIEPHLGTLTRATGKMPHPKGMIETAYSLEKGKWKVEIHLPPETPGTLIWKGKEYVLKKGASQVFTLDK